MYAFASSGQLAALPVCVPLSVRYGIWYAMLISSTWKISDNWCTI